ncbi:MAG: undecaprenyl/decaprenyl-phosphate alpha-N-acetylglucosaminyl 1-phosphate transferase [Proteobacteria bacterium]|nr:undecaprenyl/decaprenyl-phosphate alpha-N-acetylglucosaminyl 1-phosphate transferase [Pseudomonadota bacterium]
MASHIASSSGALFVMTAAATFAMVCALQPLARRFGLLDHPAGRKDHAHPTPTTGGIAILLGLLLGMTLLGRWTGVEIAFAWAAGLLVVVGALDDRFDLPWWLRIGVQCAAVLLVYRSGVSAQHVGGLFGARSLGLGDLALPVTMFATVGVINALNMSDGVDGLAGGVALTTFCMFLAAAIYSGNAPLSAHLLVMSGAVLGFWMMNMRFAWQPKARVFMGNAGSALLGFTIAWISFRLTQNDAHPVTPILAPWLVVTPLMDCVVLIARRLLHRQSPFHADRNHLHHLMLDGGFTPARLVLTLMAINLLFGLAASLALIAGVPQPALVLAFVVLCLAWFWLTLRRERGVAFCAWLRHPVRQAARSDELAT